MSAHLNGQVVGVIITVYKDRTFDIQLKVTPAAELLKVLRQGREGQRRPGFDKIGKVTMAQCKEMAKAKGEVEDVADPDFGGWSSRVRHGRWGLPWKDEKETFAMFSSIREIVGALLTSETIQFIEIWLGSEGTPISDPELTKPVIGRRNVSRLRSPKEGSNNFLSICAIDQIRIRGKREIL